MSLVLDRRASWKTEHLGEIGSEQTKTVKPEIWNNMKYENPSECISDPVGHGLIACSPVPDAAKNVWGKTYRMNNLSHCLTSVCPPGTWWRQQRRRSPPPPWTAHRAWPVPSSPSTENWDLSRRMPVCFSRVNVTFPQPNNPLATEFVCLVLPHWFDPCKDKDSTGEYSSYSCHSANPPILKRWKSLWLASSPGFTWKCLFFIELLELCRW